MPRYNPFISPQVLTDDAPALQADHSQHGDLASEPGCHSNGEATIQHRTSRRGGAYVISGSVARCWALHESPEGRGVSGSSPVTDFVVRAASPAARNASRQPLSVAAVTPSPRDTVSRSSPHNNRNTAAAFRCRDHPATAAGRRCARLSRSLRVARPRFDVLLLVHLTPLRRKCSAYGVSQSTVGRGTLRLPRHHTR